MIARKGVHEDSTARRPSALVIHLSLDAFAMQRRPLGQQGKGGETGGGAPDQ